MTAADTAQEPTIADLRAAIARLVVASTSSWPGDSVFSDRTRLLLTAEDAVRESAAVRRERDELKAKPAAEAPRDREATVELHAAVRDVIVQRCLSRPVRELSAPNVAGAIADEVLAVVRRAGGTAVASGAVLEEMAVRMLRVHVYGTLSEPRYDASARNQWNNVLDEEDRETWRREASILLAIAGAAADDRAPGSFYWTARHQLAEALNHKGMTDASVTFEELVAHARDIRLTWLSDNGQIGLASEDATPLDLSPAAHAAHAEWDVDGAFRSVECARKGCPLCLGSPWVQRQMATEPDPAAEAPRG